MRGACACTVVCALLAVCALCSSLEDHARLAAERQLLALMGLSRRPKHTHTHPHKHVPAAMRLLYQNSDRLNAIPRAAVNTVRSFHHEPTPLDLRFPNEHRFRLYFNLSAVPGDERARGADLTLQRAPAAGQGTQRLALYDIVEPGRRGRTAPVLRLLDSVRLAPGEGAVTADALGAARRWLAEPHRNYGLLLRVTEEDESGSDARSPHVRVRRRASETDLEWHDARPLLMLYTEDSRGREARESRERSEAPLSRMRRAAQRRGHRGQHRHKEARQICQRKPLFVDFHDVGWSDWIMAPQGYDAYYCQGDCPFPLSEHLNSTNHAIVQTLVNSVNPASVPKACCVPTQLASISMLYLDEHNVLVLKHYQDMAVLGCGCR